MPAGRRRGGRPSRRRRRGPRSGSRRTPSRPRRHPPRGSRSRCSSGPTSRVIIPRSRLRGWRTVDDVGDATDDLAVLWRWFGEQQFRGYSPIYERIAEAVAGDREVLELFGEAPPAAHLPMAPLGAVRYLLLDGLDHPLGEVYAGRSDADPGPLFLDLCRAERSDILALLADAAGADQRLRAQRAPRTGAHLGGRAAPGSLLPRRRRDQRRAQPPVRPLPAGLRPPRRHRPGRLARARRLRGDRRRSSDRRPAPGVRAAAWASTSHRSTCRIPTDAALAARLRVARHRPGRAGRGLHPPRPAGPADGGRRPRQRRAPGRPRRSARRRDRDRDDHLGVRLLLRRRSGRRSSTCSARRQRDGPSPG